MAEQRNIVRDLKRSRAGFKANVTSLQKKTSAAADDYDEEENPRLLEVMLEKWLAAWGKFEVAEQKIIENEFAEQRDLDQDKSDMEDILIKYESLIRGYRADYDVKQVQEQRESRADGDPAPAPQPQGRATLPKLTVHLPDKLDEDTDVRTFRRWLPSWENYARLVELEERGRQTQVATFWQCCTPGFLKIVNHTIGIQNNTGRELTDIFDCIKRHLRSLRNAHVDMKDLLSVRMKDGQDYTSLCNEIRELGDYADAATVTEDRLYIGLLLLAMKSNSDKAKLMAENPTTFEDARKFILALETARKGAKYMDGLPAESSGTKSIARMKTSTKYSKKKWDNVKGSKSREEMSDTKKKCSGCERVGHSKADCPLKDMICFNCKGKGHLKASCKTKRAAKISIGGQSGGGDDIPVRLEPPGKSFALTRAVPDTGAGISVMGKIIFQRSGLARIVELGPPIKERIMSVNGQSLQQVGTFKTDVWAGNEVATMIKVVVCSDVKEFFLDRDACRKLHIVSPNFPHPDPPTDRIGAINIASDNKKSSQEEEEETTLGEEENSSPRPKGQVSEVKTDRPPTNETCDIREVWPDRTAWLNTLPEDVGDDKKIFEKIEEILHEKYAKVFDDSSTLRPMKGPIVGEPMRIRLKENYKPFAIHTARVVPYALRDKVKAALDDMVKKGVIEKLDDTPTEWCHPVVIAPKPNGDIRFCVDLTKLNTEVIPSSHHTKTPAEAISGFSPEDKYFAKLDLVKGYWQMPLAKESQALTTFITAYGRYKFLRSPMGFISTGDSYSFRGDIAIDGLPINKVIDDMGIGQKTFKQLVKVVCETLERCAKHGLTVNKTKSKLCAREIDFVGYKISENSIEADKKKLAAITEFPVPETLTDLRSFLGLVNQLGGFSKEVSGAAGPLRDLLKKKNEFQFLAAHRQAFEETKKTLVSPPVLGMFDRTAETCLQTDASKLKGLGFALMQRPEGSEEWKLIQCGSRFLKDVEQRYAVMELEALAIFWAIKKCHVYLAGMPHFTVMSDHKPLKNQFNNFAINAIENPRVQNYRSRLANYSFTVEWKEGKSHCIPDALSRNPVEDPEDDIGAEVDEDVELDKYVIAAMTSTMPDIKLNELREKAAQDKDYMDLVIAVQGGFPSKPKSAYVKQFKKIVDELTTDKGLILRGCRIVVPPTMVKSVLKQLHASHMGVEKTKRRARQTLFWFGYSNDIKNITMDCMECQRLKPSHQKEELIQEELPSRPFEVATSDLFLYGSNHYLVYADRLTGFALIEKYRNAPSSTDLLKTLRRFFSMMGVPNVLRSDQGKQYSSEMMRTFLRNWGVEWRPSSPRNPQSNGHAEVMVKGMKHLLQKVDGDIEGDAFQAGLLELRNGPREDGLSPAQRLFGRPLRSQVPAHWRSFAPGWQRSAEEADKVRFRMALRRKVHFDKAAKNLEKLREGARVILQDPTSHRWDRLATVVGSDRRRYQLRMDSGRVMWRNCNFCAKC